ncbi:hypothetical protein NEOLEDRAFT_1133688 [Neolentinus lepideus HHB14362 ss-1]|uniref:Secreted protein n=1 Tax=Neolentinus lepideus HHB14362 ss-1 TaxID=1314782 RepID=A0A165SKZ3_9AGAM|nr:hypothetical protein NEOLEDRAFT_1133688 [Neolentinus lepideus HHB14362 ss-1]
MFILHAWLSSSDLAFTRSTPTWLVLVYGCGPTGSFQRIDKRQREMTEQLCSLKLPSEGYRIKALHTALTRTKLR